MSCPTLARSRPETPVPRESALGNARSGGNHLARALKMPPKRWYSLPRWRYRVAHQLRDEPCWFCAARGTFVAAEVVDHVVPHRGSWELFWTVRSNRCARAAIHATSSRSRKRDLPAVAASMACQLTRITRFIRDILRLDGPKDEVRAPVRGLFEVETTSKIDGAGVSISWLHDQKSNQGPGRIFSPFHIFVNH